MNLLVLDPWSFLFVLKLGGFDRYPYLWYIFGIKHESEVDTLVEVKRKEGESFESLLRRFNRKIQQSGVLVRARKIRFFAPNRSRNLLREDAARRAVNREKREELKRQGKLPMVTTRFKRR